MDLPFKLPCPNCAKGLKIVQQPPLRVRCPGCGTKVAINAAGQASILRETAQPVAPAGRNPLVMVLIALLVLGVGGGGGWFILQKLNEKKDSPGPVVDAGKKDKEKEKEKDKEPEKGPELVIPPPPSTTYLSKVAEAKEGALPVGVEVTLAKASGGVEVGVKNPRLVMTKAAVIPGVDQAKVDQAVDNGVDYLRAHKLQDERVGAKALVGMTLLSCGVPAKDPDVKSLAEIVRARAPQVSQTYEICTCIWFLDKVGLETDKDLIRSLGLRLIAGQKDNSGWGYTCPPLSAEQEIALMNFLAGKGGEEGVGNLDFLVKKQASPSAGAPVYQDNSITQFAVLALWSAKKHGLPTEKTLSLVEKRFRRSQTKGGAWTYSWLPFEPLNPGWAEYADSMTCAGLLAMAVCRGRELEKLPALTDPAKKEGPGDPAIEKGFAYLGNRLEQLGGNLPVAAGQLRQKLMQTQGQLKNRSSMPPAQAAELESNLKKYKEEWGRLVPGMPLPLTGGLTGPGLVPGPMVNPGLPGMPPTLPPTIPGMPPGPPPGKGIVPGGVPPVGAPPVPGAPGATASDGFLGAHAMGDLYFLWSLERMAVVYDLKTIGKTDWYAWGANQILPQQQSDGRWPSVHGDIPGTCFALLFLRRANAVQDLTVALQNLSVSKNAGERGGYGQGQGPSTGVVKGLQ